MCETSTQSNQATLQSSQLDSLETSLHEPDANFPLAAENLADEAGISFRHSGWEPRRRRVQQAIEGMDDAKNRNARFRLCGSHAWVLESDLHPGTYRISCDKCKDRFCQPCATDRARHIASCVGQFAGTRDIRFVTLTLRFSNRTIQADVDRLYAAFVKLRRRVRWKQTQIGGIYFLEIKRRGDDDGWHVHLHVLTEGHWLCKRWLSQAWHEVTGDSFIVDIRECKSSERAAQYAAKYAGKGVHGHCYHNPDVLREAILAIRGRRLVGKWGTWSALDLNEQTREGDWQGVDTLARLIERSERGELKAAAILQALIGVESCPTNPSEHRARGP